MIVVLERLARCTIIGIHYIHCTVGSVDRERGVSSARAGSMV